MIEGIKILNTIKEVSYPDWWWIPLVVVMILSILIGTVLGIILKSGIVFQVSVAVGVVICLIYAAILPDDTPTGKYIYKVTIEDSTNLLEFDNLYTIISQEGELYTIKEK